MELTGQIAHFDTFNCTTDDADLIAARAYGACHLPCLRLSGWATRWVERWIERMERTGWRDVGLDGEYRGFHWSGGQPRTSILRSNGESWEILDSVHIPVDPDQDHIRHVDDGEYNVDLTGWPGFAEEVQQALLSVGTYPLLDLVERLGLIDKLARTEPLASGFLKYEETLREYWAEGWVSCLVEYGEYVPREVWDITKRARRFKTRK